MLTEWQTSRERLAQFVESRLFEIDLLTGHESGIAGAETPPSTAGVPAGDCLGRRSTLADVRR